MLRLAAPTAPSWVPFAVAHLDRVLLDHAHLEKKAAGAAVALLFRHPERPALQAPLARLARDELAHFEQALAQLARRGIPFAPQRPGSYAGRLHAEVRPAGPERLLDQLLVAALIEARSCERMGLLAAALRPDDAELARWLEGLLAAEARHHGAYVALAREVVAAAEVAARLEGLARHEATVVAELAARGHEPRLHG
jgi:tRNA-(ms[2]io[6]A)-hydroxylase